MRLPIVVAFSLVALVVACGGPASSAPPPAEVASSEAAPAASEPAPTGTSDGETEAEAEGSSGPPACVPVGRSCATNAYCCYGSCRAEGGSPELLCRP